MSGVTDWSNKIIWGKNAVCAKGGFKKGMYVHDGRSTAVNAEIDFCCVYFPLGRI